MTKIRILGAGGLARELQAHLKNHRGIESFMVDSWDANPSDETTPTIIGIGGPNIKRSLDDHFCAANWGLDVHAGCEVGEGSVFCPGVQATVNVKIGRHVLVNLNCTIGHDAVIGDYCTINPGANISGNVTIGEGCLIGTGATIIEKITIAPWSIIGAGAVVVSDITEPGTYVGVPAKRIK